MANEEHIALLKQGVTVWNEWRKKAWHVRPDLRGANLSGFDLSNTDLATTNLKQAKLAGANLRDTRLWAVDLSDADLKDADIRGASLNRANLSGVDLSGNALSGVNLNGANLSGTNLVGADLTGANLSGGDLRDKDLSSANLRGADLSEADLRKTNLRMADLSGLDLRRTNFIGTNLQETQLSQANLSEVDLRNNDLSGADLSAADLRGTNLIDAILDKANLTATTLWATQRDRWSIKGVTCEFAFWDREGKEPTYYAASEFERLHAETVKIELHYEGGFSRTQVNTLPLLINQLETMHSGCVLHLKSIEDAPGGARATIVVEDTGGQNPERLVNELQKEADSLRHQLALIEHELDAMYNRVFPAILKQAMTGTKQITIETVETLGILGNISGNAEVELDQSFHYNQNDLTRIKDLVTDILARQAELKPNLSAQRLADLEASLNSTHSQLSQNPPDQSFIKKSLGAVKRILEGATANVVAREWLKLLAGLA